jgi:hypothetical protein
MVPSKNPPNKLELTVDFQWIQNKLLYSGYSMHDYLGMYIIYIYLHVGTYVYNISSPGYSLTSQTILIT